MKKIWIHRSGTFHEAERFDFEYYRVMGPTRRLETIQRLRELDQKLQRGIKRGQSRKGLRRVITVVQ